MDLIFIGIVIFLCVLAVFDLVVGVSNDAVNFINSAVGARVAPYKVVVGIAAVGVLAGASLSNGMMDVARHGIFSPAYFSFFEVICIFLSVMVADVIILDVFNSLGLPTSTTVSMVFELLGGAFALTIVKINAGMMDADGRLLGFGDLLNTDKALSVILAIFLSVAVAFLFGALVMWLSRLLFTFVKPRNRSFKTILFGGVSVTAIIWFLLINGLKSSSLMTPDVKEWVDLNTWNILGVCAVGMTLLMALLSFLRVNILKTVVLTGTFALAMAFAGNDLVNFIGVPLTGLDAYLDFSAHGAGDADAFMMSSLQDSAQTPIIFLLVAGIIMVLSLTFSKKAQNVVRTSVDLSRQADGDEMFGSSGVARVLVRASMKLANGVLRIVPRPVVEWVDGRFCTVHVKLPDNAAFDMVRASVNLVLAGLLVAFGTSHKLPLSTTYVTFMVAMGASLADRAWGRESAVFRLTGVISVIGGWFITAGVAFALCYLVTNAMFFGGYVVMLLSIVVAIGLLIRSHLAYEKKEKEEDEVFHKLIRSQDQAEIWKLLCEHIRKGNAARLDFVMNAYKASTDAYLSESYTPLRRASGLIDEERNELKRQRRREIVAMRRLDPLMMIQRNTWYFLGINSCLQMLYGMKRINDPIREHVGSNFSPLPQEYRADFLAMRDGVIAIYERAFQMLQKGDFSESEQLRSDCLSVQMKISSDRKIVLDNLQNGEQNMNTLLLTVHILQESQELVGSLRHMLRGMRKFLEV